jgi:hypothetical protein
VVPGAVTQYPAFLLLESFLDLREHPISSVALEYYIKTMIFYPDPPAPSYYLSAAVSAAFSFLLPGHSLSIVWTILDIPVNGL